MDNSIISYLIFWKNKLFVLSMWKLTHPYGTDIKLWTEISRAESRYLVLDSASSNSQPTIQEMKLSPLWLLTRGVSITLWPCHLHEILRQKKNYGDSNISPCKNIIFKKSSKKTPNPSRCYNSVTNLKFQHKPKYHL